MSVLKFAQSQQLSKLFSIQELGKFPVFLNLWQQTNSYSSNTNEKEKENIDFGFKSVSKDEKESMVGNVFSNVANKYDVMNDLMSLGVHRLWKNEFVSMVKPFPGMDHLDVAGGTGDIAFRILNKLRKLEQNGSKQGSVMVADINPQMLQQGKEKAQIMGISQDTGLSFVECNAEQLPMQDESFDAYTIVFGIRNVTNRDQALKEAYRVLRPGGRFLCMEFSPIETPVFKQFYDWYSFNIIPRIGQAVAGDQESYKYLVESIRMFPNKDVFAEMIAQAGFQGVKYSSFTQGIVYVHQGIKLTN